MTFLDSTISEKKRICANVASAIQDILPVTNKEYDESIISQGIDEVKKDIAIAFECKQFRKCLGIALPGSEFIAKKVVGDIRHYRLHFISVPECATLESVKNILVSAYVPARLLAPDLPQKINFQARNTNGLFFFDELSAKVSISMPSKIEQLESRVKELELLIAESDRALTLGRVQEENKKLTRRIEQLEAQIWEDRRKLQDSSRHRANKLKAEVKAAYECGKRDGIALRSSSSAAIDNERAFTISQRLINLVR